MNQPPEGWRTGKQTRAYFADHGIDVHLSTITRQREKYPDLFVKIGRTLWIDAVTVLKNYREDYAGMMRAGELSGSRANRAYPDAPVEQPGDRAAPVETKPPVAPPPANDSHGVPLDPTKRKAHYQALELQRKAAEAEGLLLPAASAHAAVVNAITEAKTRHQALIEPVAERIAALLKDETRAPEISSILEEMFRAAWNSLSDAAAREMTESNPAAVARFRELEAFADGLFGLDEPEAAIAS